MVCGFLFDELQISQDWADKGATYIHVSSDSWKQSLAKTTSFSKQPKKKPTIPKGPHVPLYHCFYLPLRMSFTGLSHSSEICFHSQRKTDTTSDLFSRKAQLLILMNSPKQRFPIFPSATTHSSSVVGHNASGQNDLPGIFRGPLLGCAALVAHSTGQHRPQNGPNKHSEVTSSQSGSYLWKLEVHLGCSWGHSESHKDQVVELMAWCDPEEASESTQ